MPTLQFSAAQLLTRLPHRHPFVLLDRVEDVIAGVSGVGVKNITISDPVFAGHFPGEPIYPGVLMIEAAGQTCGIIASADDETTASAIGYLASVKRFTFRRLVRPGDRLELRCTRSVSLGNLVEFRCALTVGSHTVADGVLALALNMGGAAQP